MPSVRFVFVVGVVVVAVDGGVGAEELLEAFGCEDGFGRAGAGDGFVKAEDAVGVAADDGEVVGDPDGGQVAALVDGLEQVAEERFAGHVDGAGGFVEQEDLGFLQEGLGEQDALEFAAGELAEAAFFELLHADAFEDGGDALAHAVAAAEPQGAALDAAGEEIADAERDAAVEVEALGDVAEGGAGGCRPRGPRLGVGRRFTRP